ncbi:GxxExxY protein [Ignavibacterium album]|uniref:GxxExxY protein n=1 Tax=Ignavibacterium album TaxID=591197 RepID=UPI001B3C4BF8
MSPQRRREIERDELNKLGSNIFDVSIEVHKILGAGLLETVYELSLFKESLIIFNSMPQHLSI